MDDAAKTLTIKLDDANTIEFSAAGITVTGKTINLN